MKDTIKAMMTMLSTDKFMRILTLLFVPMITLQGIITYNAWGMPNNTFQIVHSPWYITIPYAINVLAIGAFLIASRGK
ncbi:MAG: hypothetical protein ACW99G_17845 [Candidatus Thorarchaeota archaeon]|jgi:hypothetical protein